MAEKKEIWKDVPGYEGYYQGSNLGRVRSVDRNIVYSNGISHFYKGSIINGSHNRGYKYVSFSRNNIKISFRFSQVIAMTFLNHEVNGHKSVVDHINGDKSDDRVENLRIVTQRENASTCYRSYEDSLSSMHIGVSWDTRDAKWRATISYKGVRIHLGYFVDELKASNAYQKALSKIEDGTFNLEDYKPKWASMHKGVSFNKRSKKWIAYKSVDNKRKYLGYFKTELEAYKASQN